MSNGKGSKPRPLSTSYAKYANNYDAIFRKKKFKGVVVNPEYVGKVTIIKGENGKAEVRHNGKITGAQG